MYIYAIQGNSSQDLEIHTLVDIYYSKESETVNSRAFKDDVTITKFLRTLPLNFPRRI